MAAPNLVNVSSIYGKTLGAALNTNLNNAILANAGGSNKLLKINSIIVANVDGSNAADVSVEFYNGSTAYRLASTVTVPADSTLIVLGKDAPIYVEEGCSIRSGASAASDLEIVISYEELDDA
jgi:hypothetical protein|tara:strand:- start:672 stop:1040 length:369 start_codon:yes stop_codon:yes gene_type:complete